MNKPAQDPTATVTRLLDVIELDILPKTRAGVAAGNKVFGAAVLSRSSLELVAAATNRETEGSFWHGEMSALAAYFNLAQRPAPDECALLSTHEPCSMCASAIAWCGIKHVWYLFSYEDTRDEFEIPHDLNMLTELFGASSLNHHNRYFDCLAIRTLAQASAESKKHEERIMQLQEAYRQLSATYQEGKHDSGIPLA